jgi:uncharacterized protein YbbC (DUF1343 family)
LPALDARRSESQAFQVLGAPWMNAEAVCERISPGDLPGVSLHPVRYEGCRPPFAGKTLHGVQLTVTDPVAFRPVATAVYLLCAIRDEHGLDALIQPESTREDFFDHLAGDPGLLAGIKAGKDPRTIQSEWAHGLRCFEKTRQGALLYPA